ncbi:hypothetical protein GCM10010376_79480 [Streptomyces violaceusniger]
MGFDAPDDVQETGLRGRVRLMGIIDDEEKGLPGGTRGHFGHDFPQQPYGYVARGLGARCLVHEA